MTTIEALSETKPKTIPDALKKHNCLLNSLKYHVKTAKDEDEKKAVLNKINSIKLVYNLSATLDKYSQSLEHLDVDYIEDLNQIIDRIKTML